MGLGLKCRWQVNTGCYGVALMCLNIQYEVLASNPTVGSCVLNTITIARYSL